MQLSIIVFVCQAAHWHDCLTGEEQYMLIKYVKVNGDQLEIRIEANAVHYMVTAVLTGSALCAVTMLPESSIVQKSSTRIIYGLDTHNPVTPALFELCWL